ncbi:MAG: menaquinone biosynthesis protein [Acidobacteriota bacterium]|nr:menaquinone biosynthesis protein [Acidobacteriota bacterium]
MRVSAVSYLNTCPLIWGMIHGPQTGALDLKFELPAECANSLESGGVDVGLVPVAELIRQGLEPVPGLGIASDGPVRSIFLISRTPIRKIRTLALDHSSRTSVALARIILAERYGVVATETWSPPNITAMLEQADAGLIIGDPALRLNPADSGHEFLDLGSEWQALTQLPMVYAVWAGRPERISDEVAEIFRHSYEYGGQNLQSIIERESAARAFPESLVREYLTSHIRYELGDRHYQGMREFMRMSRQNIPAACR